MTRLFLLVAVLGLLACESDDAKLKRLESAKLTDCLIAQSDERAVRDAHYVENARVTDEASEMAARMVGDVATANEIARARQAAKEAKGAARVRAALGRPDTAMERAAASRRKCELATRDYNRFIR